MNKKKGGLLLSLRKDMNRRAISDRRLEANFRTLSRHPYIVAAFICLALTGFGSYSYKFLNGVIVCGVFMIIELFYLRRFLKQLDDSGKHTAGSVLTFAGKTLLTLAAVNYFVHTQYKAAFICFAGLCVVLVMYVALLNNDKKFHDRVTWQEQALSCAIPMSLCPISIQDRMTCGISAARAVTQAI